MTYIVQVEDEAIVVAERCYTGICDPPPDMLRSCGTLFRS